MSLIVALLGAESTGKTTLAVQLTEALRGEGRSVGHVSEYLRAFCDQHGRTPHQHEQVAIAAEQTRRIEVAAQAHEFVIADTSAMMIAVYSDFVFGDASLYAEAERAQQRIGLSLLTALDLPWQADGLQRDGPQVREPVQALVRASLRRSGVGYCVVSGTGPARLDAALQAVRHTLKAPAAAHEAAANPRWQWVCERCDDGACERHLLPRG